MSYYTIPKINHGIKINFSPQKSEKPIECCMNHTLSNYLKDMQNIYKRLIDNEETQIICEKILVSDLVEAVNPYEFIFSKVPLYNCSISKLHPSSNSFFEFIELSQSVNLFESFQKKNMNYNSFGKNTAFITEYMNIFREDKKDILENTIESPVFPVLDFIYYELNKDTYKSHNEYVIGLMDILYNISTFQKVGGVCVIKITEIYYKPIVDILFIISGLYQKCYLIKPNTSNILVQDKYLVCKFFRSIVPEDIKHNISKTIDAIHYINISGNYIQSLITNDISYYFFTKLEEYNIIIGQQQIEYLDKVINILKNKNRLDKIESLRKSNIQKCVSWCEKFKIPYNKLNDRSNIFLTHNTELVSISGFTGVTGLQEDENEEFDENMEEILRSFE
jgi:hypothetical protein